MRNTLRTLVIAALVAIIGTSTLTAAAAPAESAAGAGRISATHLDPYTVHSASNERLDAMFSTQKAAGIDTVIVQWTGARRDDGTTVTTYPASSATGFGAWDSVLPRLLDSASRNGVKVWLGLILQSSLLDADATKDDADLLAAIAADDAVIAADLLSKYKGQFEGWYIPTEPGYETIADPARTALHTDYLRDITASLDQLSSDLPVMISPSVPTGIHAGLSGVQFVTALGPLIRDTGIDVWNLQDGYKMTAWTPAQNRALVEKGQEIAAPVGADVWVTVYTPGPGDSNYPLTPAKLFADIDAVASTGAPVTIWTYNSSMNPDASRPDAQPRKTLYDLYLDHTAD